MLTFSIISTILAMVALSIITAVSAKKGMRPLAMLRRFAADNKGLALMEYGVIAALICIVCLASLTQVGIDIDAIFQAISTALQAI